MKAALTDNICTAPIVFPKLYILFQNTITPGRFSTLWLRTQVQFSIISLVYAQFIRLDWEYCACVWGAGEGNGEAFRGYDASLGSLESQRQHWESEVGGEKALGEKAKEREESVPYISISQMLAPQNHLGDF